MNNLIDPIKFQKRFWPSIYFYKEQREVIYSVVNNDETYVPAGNMLGKDFVAAYIVLYLFLTRHPFRGITTSAKDDHLRVLWGEIGRYIDTCNVSLDRKNGGPLIINHHELRKVIGKKECSLSYIKGMVASPDSIASMQGHHVPQVGGHTAWFDCCGCRIETPMARNIFVTDESSSVPDNYWTMARTWANRTLSFGNPWDCNNQFKQAVTGKPGTTDKGGDIEDPDNPGRYYRKVIRIPAEASPNVRYALAEIAAGKPVSNTLLVPGVKSYAEYKKNRLLWDPIQQCVSLDARFYEGAQVRLFPVEWLNRATSLPQTKRNKALSIGCDPAEGGDDCCWAVVGELGLIELISMKTPDTNVIPGITVMLIKKYGLKGENVWFDAGGGGRQHADRLRAQGYYVNTVGFGESASPFNLFFKHKTQRLKVAEHDYKLAYKNKRAELYGLLRLQLDPSMNEDGFRLLGVTAGPQYAELLRQLEPLPLRYDGEGVLWLPPKHKKPNSKEETIQDLIGCSPDEADALVLANFGLLSEINVETYSAEVGSIQLGAM